MRDQHFAQVSHETHSQLSQEKINNVVRVEHMRFIHNDAAAFNEEYYINFYMPPYNTVYYPNSIANSFKINDNWEFYCDVVKGKITKVCNLGNDSYKTRTLLVIDSDFKEQLQILAKKESRSLNSLMIVALKEYLENEGKK